MDKFGIPKKVNRNVIKAIYELNYEGLENPNLSNICDLVEFSMKNNVPMPNLQSVVRESLQNLYELGVIEKKGTYYYYKIRKDENVEFPPKPISSKHINTNIFKKANRKEKESSLNPNNRKRAVFSEDSIPENDPKSSIKRFRTSKTLSRKGRKVDLPKVRTPHNMNNNYQSIHTGKMEQELHSSSGNDSEDETQSTTYFTSSIGAVIYEPAKLEKKGFDESYHNSDYLPQSVKSHKKTNSQTQTHQLNKCNDTKIRINKLDVLNVSESKLDEGVENKKNSKCNQTTSEQQKEPIVLNTEQDDNISDGSGPGVKNKKSSHSECNQTINEKQKESIVLDTEQNHNISQITNNLINQDT